MKTNSNQINLLKLLPSEDVYSQCIHCGLCLPVCPTYELTKMERSSPRGRIRLIKAVAENKLSISKVFVDEMNFCLDCQACQSACPAGVKYGSLLEASRAETEKYNKPLVRILKKLVLKYILASNKMLRIAAKFLYLYQASGLKKLFVKLGILKLVSKKLADIHELSPGISSKFSDEIINEIELAEGKEKTKLAFHVGCIMNVMFADVNCDTVNLLKKINCTIYTPAKQVCCGSLQAHNGDIETAIKLAEKNILTFDKYDYEFLISNSAGCGAFMKEYKNLFWQNSNLYKMAEKFSKKVLDLSEFVINNKVVRFEDNSGKIVTYHDACHLVHSQKIFEQPRELIKSTKGCKFIEMPHASDCCGSAGIYNILNYTDSMKVLEKKIDNLKIVNPDLIITGNPGCIAQLNFGIKNKSLNYEVIHLATYLLQKIKD